MAQYQLGTIEWTLAGNRFIASADADWSGVSAGEDQIYIVGSKQPYTVGQVISPLDIANSGSGRWEIIIYGIIFEADGSGASYGIHTDWNWAGYPILQDGDYGIPQLFNQACNLMALQQTSTPQTQSMEEGIENLTSGAAYEIVVNFTKQKPSATYHPILNVVNTSADAVKRFIEVEVVNRTTTTMTIAVLTERNSANYKLHWKVGGPVDLPGSQVVISDQQLSAVASSVIFSGIPQTYTHLKLYVYGRGSHTVAQGILVQFNDDANASGYVNNLFIATGATTSASVPGAILGAFCGIVNGTDSNAADFADGVAEINFYREGNHKNVRIDSRYSVVDANAIFTSSSKWKNSVEITKITLVPVVGGTNFSAGSRFILCGIL